jgi:o-succinylbenzoate synthase
MDGMTIIAVRWWVYRLPVRGRFATAHGVLAVREGALVEVTTAQGLTGVGEIAPAPGFGSGGLADALARLPALAARLQGKTLPEGLDLLGADAAEGDTPTPVTCGLEVALLDALGKAQERSVSMLLAPPTWLPRPGVRINAVIGTPETATAVADARAAVAAGFGCIKLKVGWGNDIAAELARVAAVRAAIGPDVRLRLDANAAWRLAEAIAILSCCADYGIQYVEQPLAADDLAGMRALRRAVAIPIAADEALSTLASARRILDGEAADILVVKPQVAGGLRAGRQIIQEAAQRGRGSVITGAIEAGVGLVAALHLAAATPEVTLESGLATGPLLMDDLVSEDLPIRDGFLVVPPGPGLGIHLDREALDVYT